jgi:thiamine pyrophosphate-dependent acetolactate synthase large subunit-like protein
VKFPDKLLAYVQSRSSEVVDCCHEEILVAIAHGYAKATGHPMVAIVHDIVGLQHASMAIFNARGDRVPVLVLGGTGQGSDQAPPRVDVVAQPR